MAKNNVPDATPEGYTLVAKDFVMFLRWTEADKKLNGQLQIFAKQTNGKQSTDSSSHTFEGVLSGENVSIKFTGSVWTDGLAGTTWTGTLKNKTLSLVAPMNDGTLQTYALQPGTVNEYNQVVAQLKTDVVENNKQMEAQKLQQQQAQAEANRVKMMQDNVVYANRTVTDSIKQIQDILNNKEDPNAGFDDVLKDYEEKWQQMQADYRQLQANGSKSNLTQSDLNYLQSEVNGIQSDFNGIVSSDNGMRSVTNGVASSVSYIQRAMQSLQNNFDNLQKAVSANTTGMPQSQYSQDDINKYLNTVQQRIDKINQVRDAKLNIGTEYHNKAQKLLEDAKQYVSSKRSNK